MGTCLILKNMDNCHLEDFMPIAFLRIRDMEYKADSHFHIFTLSQFTLSRFTC